MRRDSYTTRRPGRIDWPTLRDTLNMAEVVARLIGPPSGRRGGRSARPWWRCPLGTHRDENPSFTIQPDRKAWHCFGCGESGDAVALVRRLFPAMNFPEAVAYLQVGGPPSTVQRPSTPRPEPRSEPDGMAREAAAALVAEAEARLWTPEAAHALDYLIGPRRKLAPETIRAARLGWTPTPEPRTGQAGPTALGESSSLGSSATPPRWSRFANPSRGGRSMPKSSATGPGISAFTLAPRPFRPAALWSLSKGSLTPSYSARKSETWPEW